MHLLSESNDFSLVAPPEWCGLPGLGLTLATHAAAAVDTLSVLSTVLGRNVKLTVSVGNTVETDGDCRLSWAGA